MRHGFAGSTVTERAYQLLEFGMKLHMAKNSLFAVHRGDARSLGGDRFACICEPTGAELRRDGYTMPPEAEDRDRQRLVGCVCTQTSGAQRCRAKL